MRADAEFEAELDAAALQANPSKKKQSSYPEHHFPASHAIFSYE
jgi:hypothetical protein